LLLHAALLPPPAASAEQHSLPYQQKGLIILLDNRFIL
jgi:hypothetical protein